MKKLLAIFFSVIVLSACSAKDAAITEYKADAKHLESIVFKGVDQHSDSLVFLDGNVTIVEDAIFNSIKPNTNPEDLVGKSKSEKTYKIVSISTKGDTYFVKGENNFSLELKRVGNRIISDEEGQKYDTSVELD